MAEKSTIFWEDYRGREVRRDVRHTLNIEDFVGTPGYALLVAAANTNLSVPDIRRFLDCAGVGRSASWIQKRRWLFQQPGTSNRKGPIADIDGQETRALELARAHQTMSLRSLVALLKEHGIPRSREWVRKHKCG